jgi:tRNA1Val (adenine37-N6)-methyltransferase
MGQESPSNPKKFPCPDCSFCQWCSDDRCNLCRGVGHPAGRKLCQAEQIALFESLNRTPVDPGETARSSIPLADDETLDELRGYDLRLIQPRNGYRFSLDPLLLCDFAEVPAQATIIDLGTGCGVIPLVLARRAEGARLVGIEHQPAMAELARRNVQLNGLAERVTIQDADVLDLRSGYPVDCFDLVLANPPFRVPGTGRVSPRPGRDLARHESTAGLADFLEIAKYLVQPGGRICFIYHPERLVEFMAIAHRLGLAVTRLRLVHGHVAAAARMFLAELGKGCRESLQILPPLFVHDRNAMASPSSGTPVKEAR